MNMSSILTQADTETIDCLYKQTINKQTFGKHTYTLVGFGGYINMH